MSLSRECNWVTIEADKLLRHTVKNAGLRLCEKYFSKDIYASLTCKVLKDKEIVNCVDRIIKVTSGCLLDEDNQKH